MRALAVTALLCAASGGFLAGRWVVRRSPRRSTPEGGALGSRPRKPPERRPPLSEADGEVVYAHFRAGSELLDGGNPAQACVRLEKARALAPDRCSIREALGRAYFAVGRLTEAEAEFRAVVAQAPSDDYAHYCLSRTLRRLGRSTEAGSHLNLARALRPGDARYALFGY